MRIQPSEVHGVLRRSILVEGYPFVLDAEKSHGQYLHDAVTGRDYLDFFTFYASRPVRFDHPRLSGEDFQREVFEAARMKPSNCDIYTSAFAEFVEAFRTIALGPEMAHLFFIDGGTLAVENALKTAFDWKVQKNLARGQGEKGTSVIHFTHAFHGRSGYALSLTNTSDPRKTRYFPKFPWPRVPSPALSFPVDAAANAAAEEAEKKALAEIDAIYDRLGQDEIACIIIEPIQCEGGDRHFRRDFLKALRTICDERETMLIFDEVQTGMGSTGSMWLYEQTGVVPDLVAFAKKAQTGGIMATKRVDEIDSVFKVKSRISSTFGGNLVDFVRARRYLEIIRDEKLVENAKVVGNFLFENLVALSRRYDRVTNVRGVGTLQAFDLPTGQLRDQVVSRAQQEGLLVLPCGDQSVRLRPALDVSRQDAEVACDLLDRTLKAVLG
ncbi:L-lysine 6-transaminase [Myxococcota bacterium]|nr:L-lysine 6-transaminase [Myxococcota bacterium]